MTGIFEQEIKIIETYSEMEQAATQILLEKLPISFDTETLGLDPLIDKVRLIQIGTVDTIYIIDVFRFGDLTPIKAILESPDVLKIIQNAKFDVKMIQYQFGIYVERIIDLMLCNKLIHAGQLEFMRKNSLADLAQEYLSVHLDKTYQASDWSGPLSKEQIEYAAKDVMVLLPLAEVMIERLKKDQLIAVARLESKCALAVSTLELNGVYVDLGIWAGVTKDIELQHQVLEKQLKTLLGNQSMNLSSPIQVKKALNDLGVHVDSTNEKILTPYKNKHPAVAALLNFRGVEKLLTSYGDGVPGKKPRKGQTRFQEYIHPVTGRIHPDFTQIVNTGRFSCSNPNVQQVPAPRTARLREAFIGQYGRKLIIADYSQVELRILADMSEDYNMMEAFQTGKDLHIWTAAMMFKLSYDSVTKNQRDAAKALNFG